MQPSGEIGRFEVDDLPSPPADRRRCPTEMMIRFKLKSLLIATAFAAALLAAYKV
ncbi:hypothetical protein SAMN06265222_1251, partial [Neorhodopirellula lusitana]